MNAHTRDMTRREFRSALTRRGWRQVLMWVNGTGKDGLTTGVGMVMTRKGRRGWQTNYRASLAKAIRKLQEGDAV